VRKVVKVKDTAVGPSSADTWWRAKSALDALPIEWDEGAGSAQSERHRGALKEGLTAANHNGGRQNGMPSRRSRTPPRRSRRSIRRRSGARHMEPMNCTAKIGRQGRGVGADAECRSVARGALGGVRPGARQMRGYRPDLGGGFGRRGATRIRSIRRSLSPSTPGTPVKLIWSREEDMAHDFYRPFSQCKLSAARPGRQARRPAVRLSGHRQRLGQSVPAGRRSGRTPIRAGNESGRCALGYSVADLAIEYAMRNTHVPVGPMARRHTNQNGLYMECFMDEVARAAGKDPLAFRRGLMEKFPKHLAVLNAAAAKATTTSRCRRRASRHRPVMAMAATRRRSPRSR